MSIEAMKQALEALQYPWKSQPHTVVNAITALRAAIESQERAMKLRQDIAHHLSLADGINAELAMQRITDVQQEMEFGANSVSITALPTHDYVKESREILEDAASVGFVSVVIFGFKDRQVHIKHSSMVNELELFGALEAAKMQLWGRGE